MQEPNGNAMNVDVMNLDEVMLDAVIKGEMNFGNEGMACPGVH